ncbi:MAG: phosphatidylglycerophosphatase A [candidate division Zixibacteria bacterium]|nr:phosphatidylglycerophosphatase A [candidate division Zixibacteria bacterium]
MDNLIKFLASGFYSSYGKKIPIPGTRGTVPIWLIAFFLIKGNQPVTIGLAIIITILSIYLSGKAEKFWGHDAGRIVIDEWAGMMITLILVPYSLINYIAAFIFFRITDVIKIPPARNAEKLPGGWGITIDDVVAGIQANILTHIFVYIMNNYV